MSMRCEEVRPLLAELVYEEVDADVAERLRDHLGTCLSCRRHQMAFLAVRRDLQEWQPERQPETPSVTFIAPGGRDAIAPGGRAAAPIWHSRTFQGLAAAAGFVFVAVLLAAVVNLQVRTGPDGVTLSTGFGAAQDVTGDAPPTFAVEQIRGLDRWFDARFERQLGTQLTERGVVTLANMPAQQFFSEEQVRELNRRVTERLDTGFAARDVEVAALLDTELENMRYYVDTSLDQQANVFFVSVQNLVEGLEAGHRDEIFQLTRDFSNLYVDTDRKLQEANNRIDNLLSLAAPSRSPEQ